MKTLRYRNKQLVDFIMTSAEGQGIDIDEGGAQAMIDDMSLQEVDLDAGNLLFNAC